MQSALRVTQTTIGLKAIMATTGLLLFGFVVVHMLGNLQIYAGPEKINAYAALLKSQAGLLWAARAGLLAIVAMHVLAAIALANRNAGARSSRYKVQRHQRTTYAARTMYWSGPILGFYILYHIAHLTLGYGDYGSHEFSHTNVYDNLVFGFREPLVAAIYIIGNIALVIHLRHGLWSLFQSLGFNHPRYNAWRDRFATAGAAIILIGNLSIPISVLTGVVKPSSELETDSAATSTQPMASSHQA